jgi:hypothetical protein
MIESCISKWEMGSAVMWSELPHFLAQKVIILVPLLPPGGPTVSFACPLEFQRFKMNRQGSRGSDSMRTKLWDSNQRGTLPYISENCHTSE